MIAAPTLPRSRFKREQVPDQVNRHPNVRLGIVHFGVQLAAAAPQHTLCLHPHAADGRRRCAHDFVMDSGKLLPQRGGQPLFFKVVFCGVDDRVDPRLERGRRTAELGEPLVCRIGIAQGETWRSLR
jgi:hypothetical protein